MIVYFIISVISLLLGGLTVFLLMKMRIVPLEATNAKKDDELHMQRELLSRREKEMQGMQEKINELLQQNSSKGKEIELMKLMAEEEKLKTSKLFDEQKKMFSNQIKEVEQLKNDLVKQKNLTAKTESERDTTRKEVAMLREQMQKNEQERTKALVQQLDMAKEQLQNATQEILRQREESLRKTNSEQLEGVVKPLKEQLVAMQKQVQENIKANAENKTSIEDAIRSLMQRTQEISNDANNLARALKNESKTQGNWGEMILETLLENSGLEEGKHYEKQSTLRDAHGRPVLHDETGKRLIPDVVVHYPDGKDCVIDSKVSLSNYIDYCNSESDSERELALARHVDSIRKHVKELVNKDYATYIKAPRQTMGYTIMFIPNENAMQIALQSDIKLWNEAFEKGVCITSEQNLLVLLRMIRIAWTQVQQAHNQQEVFDQAKRLLDRVADFADRFEKVGEQIHKADEAFGNARSKLYNGQQSIIKAAKDMEKLGARTSGKRALPEPSDWRN